MKAAQPRIPASLLVAMLSLGIVGLFVARTPAAEAGDAGSVVKVGAGGYLTSKPNPCKPLPEKIYKTANLKGAIPTGQWWSSLLWLPYSQPMYAHPLALTCTAKGLNVSFPGANIHSDKSAIFAFVGAKDADLELGHSGDPVFSQADCDSYSDWFVTAAWVSGDIGLVPD